MSFSAALGRIPTFANLALNLKMRILRIGFIYIEKIMSFKERLMQTGTNLLKDFDTYGGYDLSWGTAAYSFATGEKANVIQKYKFTIVALQVDATSWDRINDSKSGSLRSMRSWLGKETKKILQKEIEEGDGEADIIFKRFAKICPYLSLSSRPLQKLLEIS